MILILSLSALMALPSVIVEPTNHPAATAVAAEPCISRQTRNRSTNVNNDDHRYTMKYSSAGCSGDVRIEGKLRYSSNFEQITGLSEDGFIRIEENDGGTRRRLEASPSGNGLSFKWWINGTERPFDAEAREWFDAWTLLMFREMGFAANERATAMVHSGGADAILREVKLMSSDYVQATYLGVALEKGNLDAGAVERVLAATNTALESDYYIATTLTHASKGVAFSSGARRSYLSAAGKMSSDFYKEQALGELVKNGRLEHNEIAEVLRQANMIDSDYYRTTLLGRVSSKFQMDATLRNAYLSGVSGIDSDYYKLTALQKLLTQKSSLSESELASVLTTGRSIDSDYYGAELLVAVARNYALKGAARDAFMTNLNRISSDHYRASVQSALRSER